MAIPPIKPMVSFATPTAAIPIAAPTSQLGIEGVGVEGCDG
jgi:hypothetical protein